MFPSGLRPPQETPRLERIERLVGDVPQHAAGERRHVPGIHHRQKGNVIADVWSPHEKAVEEVRVRLGPVFRRERRIWQRGVYPLDGISVPADPVVAAAHRMPVVRGIAGHGRHGGYLVVVQRARPIFVHHLLPEIDKPVVPHFRRRTHGREVLAAPDFLLQRPVGIPAHPLFRRLEVLVLPAPDASVQVGHQADASLRHPCDHLGESFSGGKVFRQLDILRVLVPAVHVDGHGEASADQVERLADFVLCA